MHRSVSGSDAICMSDLLISASSHFDQCLAGGFQLTTGPPDRGHHSSRLVRRKAMPRLWASARQPAILGAVFLPNVGYEGCGTAENVYCKRSNCELHSLYCQASTMVVVAQCQVRGVLTMLCCVSFMDAHSALAAGHAWSVNISVKPLLGCHRCLGNRYPK